MAQYLSHIYRWTPEPRRFVRFAPATAVGDGVVIARRIAKGYRLMRLPLYGVIAAILADSHVQAVEFFSSRPLKTSRPCPTLPDDFSASKRMERPGNLNDKIPTDVDKKVSCQQTQCDDEIPTGVENTASSGQLLQRTKACDTTETTFQSGIEIKGSSGEMTATRKTCDDNETAVPPDIGMAASDDQVRETRSTPSTSTAAVAFGTETGSRPKERQWRRSRPRAQSGRNTKSAWGKSSSDCEAEKPSRRPVKFRYLGSCSSSSRSSTSKSVGLESSSLKDGVPSLQTVFPPMMIPQGQVENEETMVNVSTIRQGVYDLKEQLMLPPDHMTEVQNLRRGILQLQVQHQDLRRSIRRRDQILRVVGLQPNGEPLGPVTRNLGEPPRATLLMPEPDKQSTSPQDSSQGEEQENHLKNTPEDRLSHMEQKNAELKRRVVRLTKLLLAYRKIQQEKEERKEKDKK